MARNVFDPNYENPAVPKSATNSGGDKVVQPAHADVLTDVVELRGIEQVYGQGDKAVVVFRNFSLSIPDIPNRGQFCTIMGPSGCGKSTILRYISGLQKPTAGEILFKGKPRDPRKSVPMVFQEYSNLEWKSVLHNVTLPLELQGVDRKEAEDKAMAMLKVVGLEAHAKKFAKSPNLSGGQLQRVAIARSLIVQPSILLMDEPFGALDVKTRREMQDFLRVLFEAQEDMTVILVTHSESEAVFLSDKVTVLNATPATVVADIPINLPTARGDAARLAPEFEHYVAQVRKALN